MLEDRSLEGWSPVVGQDATLDEIVDLAFDYRGDVTVVRRDGAELTGYLYNRNRDVPDPYLQVFDPSGAAHTLTYGDVLTIRFTGKDTAAGKSWEAWRRRKAESQG